MNRAFIDMDGVIVDFDGYVKEQGIEAGQLKLVPGTYSKLKAFPDAIEGLKMLEELGLEVWIATKPPTGAAHAYAEKAAWVIDNLPHLKRRIIITHDKGLLGDEGDFLVDDRPWKANCEKFRGQLIRFQNGMTWPMAVEAIGTIVMMRPRTLY